MHKVWFLASEVAPFAKTGGLADVAGSLPACLKNLGVDVRVGLPFYRMAKDGNFETQKVLEGLEVPSGNTGLRCDVLETSTEEGVPVYLFDREDLFDRQGLYGTPEGDYPDNLERFTYFCRAQKGLDLLVQVLDELLALEVGLVVLGSGEEGIQKAIQEAAEHHPGCLGLKIGFDEPLAHRIMAGIDMLLVPSRYEPCGLTQIYALKYGAVPIVRATGGLDDTIDAFDPGSGEGTGFKFSDYEAKAFLDKIREALEVFEDRPGWMKLIESGMRADFSWEKSAREYVSLYEKVIEAA